MGAARGDGFSRALVKTEFFDDRALLFYKGEGFEAAVHRTVEVGGLKVSSSSSS